MELCLITDKADLAIEAEAVGVERIMIDLEREGKAQRQRGRELFLSDHRIESLPRMRAALGHTALVVRVNPLTARSAGEIDAAIAGKADFIMLPYFHCLDEVRHFLAMVRRRAKVILLVETRGAIESLPEIVRESGIDEVHIGLNDLCISLGNQVIFEPLCDGMIDGLAALVENAGLPFGFGGIARLSRRDLPVTPERVLAEQVRLRAGVGWLGRTFRGEMERRRRPGELADEVGLIRQAIEKWQSAPEAAFRQNRQALIAEVAAWKNALAS
jgi:HpcH/HpaI aldolase/citrate lyase family